MPAILQGGPDLEQPKLSDGHFLPYQVEYIVDEHRMGLIEKSVRIGFTYADSFKNVRKRLMMPKRDYLFGTKDWPTALEYMRTCQQWVEVYNRVKSVVSSGEMTVKVPGLKDDGTENGFDEEIKIGYMKFDNDSRILAFTSNPAAMQAYGGDVGLDEFAKHKKQEMLYATAQGRVTWGYDCDIWSAHWGNTNQFYDFALEAREGAGPWDYHRKITMEKAIADGLVEKINEVSGGDATREDFLADCKKRARTDIVYDQEYNCDPSGSAQAIVPKSSIVRCKRPYEIERIHLEQAQIFKLFGEFEESSKVARTQKIIKYLRSVYAGIIGATARHSLGFDVAASGQGDLSTYYIDEDINGSTAQQLRAMFTCRTEDWHFIETVGCFFMDNVSAIKGAGDETGLGRQICWRLAKKYPGRFEQVNFASLKHEMGAELMTLLSEGGKILPDSKDDNDIGEDYYALQKDNSTGKLKFSEGKNPLNQHSHCDMAWAGALSLRAMQNQDASTHVGGASTAGGNSTNSRSNF